MNDVVLCKDCKHRFREWNTFGYWGSGFEWLCRKAYVTETVEHDPVTGPKKVPAHYKRCSLTRLHDHSYSKDCGKEGVWWEPKNPKKFMFKIIKHEEIANG